MAQVYDPEELRNAEEQVSKPSSTLSSSTTPGKVRFTSNPPKSKDQSDLSTSTSPGKVAYDSSAAVTPAEQSLYRSSATKSGNLRYGNLLNSRRNKLIASGVISATIAGVSIAIFLTVLPLKILHIVNNLQDHFYASAQNATAKETDALFSTYIRRYILPAHKSCGRIITSNCNPIPTSSNPVTRLYKGWHTGNLEDKISQKYGLEFGYDPGAHKYFMKAPGITKELSLNDFYDGKDSTKTLDEFLSQDPELQVSSRGEIRQAYKDATANETRWKQTLVRYKIRGLLSEKFGIPKCIFFCGTKDKLAASLADQKNGAKIVLSRLVLEPHNKALSVALQCLFSTSCNPTADTTQPCTEGEDCAVGGAPENKDTDTKIRQSLDSLASEYGIEDTAELRALYQELVDKGVTPVISEQILATFLNEDAAKVAAQGVDKAIPILGWILLANQVAHVTDSLNGSADKVKKLEYLVNSASAVNLFAVYRVYADEVKTGQISATELGSLMSSLGPGDQSDNAGDPKVGGTAEAEQTPLYSYLLGNGSLSGSSTYKCDGKDGKPPAAVTLQTAICPEEALAPGIGPLNDLHTLLNSPPFNIVLDAAKVWDSIPGLSNILDFVNNSLTDLLGPAQKIIDTVNCFKVLGHYVLDIGGYCEIRDALQTGIQYIYKAMISLLPNPFGSVANASGGRKFDMIAAGADVSGNDFAHYGIGGQQLTPQQVADNLDQQNLEDLQHYKSQSFIARTFDTNSRYSPVSKLALAIPSSKGSAAAGLASVFSNPLGKLRNVFGSIFAGNQVFAAATAQADPFGVVQYGYPNGTIPSDPETYWNQNCADNPIVQNGQMTTAWNNASITNLDPTTQMPVSNSTDPCLLISSTVGSTGAIFDSSLLTADDLAGSNADSTSGSTSGSTKGCGGNGNYSALVSSGANFAGTDQGIDFVPTGSNGFDICAPASGTIVQADATGHHFDRTNGQAAVILKMDQAPNTPNSGSYIYFIEIIQIDSSIQIGKHVNKGDVIGHNAQSPGVEVGWASGSGGPGSGLEPLCGLGGQTACGDSFNSWVLAGGGN